MIALILPPGVSAEAHPQLEELEKDRQSLNTEISSIFIITKNVYSTARKGAVTSHKNSWKVFPFAEAGETLSKKTRRKSKQSVTCSSSWIGGNHKLNSVFPSLVSY